MRFIFYLLTAISNLALVYFLPTEMAVPFLKVYSISSMLIGILVVYAFSNPVWITWLLRAKNVTLGCFFCMAMIGVVSQEVGWLACSYAGALLLSDYFVSQGNSLKIINIYRALLICSVVPAIIGVKGYIEIILPLRILGCLAFAYVAGTTQHGLRPLSVQSPIIYIVGTHLSYFGSLTAIVWLVGVGEEVKIWYIGSQLGYGIILKLFDYQIRNEYDPVKLPIIQVYVVVVTIGVILYIWVSSLVVLATYFMGIIGLALTSRVARSR